ncbi:S26 family signal peptidase [Nonomuraea sp. 3N208]|uniref:S26 family signal peptidase n=1 Tax=Nonomuraea sp. 3N208 TaxID=3457421 RepID=UPI003FCEC58B
MRRGDIIVYRAPRDWTRITPGKLYISGVIGVPGDRVTCSDDPKARLQVNGAPLEEAFVARGPAAHLWFDATVPQAASGSRATTATLPPIPAPRWTTPAGHHWAFGRHRSGEGLLGAPVGPAGRMLRGGLGPAERRWHARLPPYPPDQPSERRLRRT